MRMRDMQGAALIEFAVVTAMLLVILLGGMRFGLAVNNDVVLNQAVRAGSRTFAFSRGKSNPRALAVARIQGASPNLTGIVIRTYVNGVECASDSACATAITSAHTANPRTAAAKVTGAISCTIKVMGVLYPCSVNAAMAERIE